MSIEMWAFRYMLDETHPRLASLDGDPNHYCLGKVCGHNVVLAWLPGEQGNTQAARVATNLSRTFHHIRWRFLVGIGGGVNNSAHRIRLGDVVIGMPSNTHGGVGQYDLGRDKNAGFQRKGFVHAPPEDLRSIVEGMKHDRRGDDSRLNDFLEAMLDQDEEIAEVYQRPPAKTDVLFPDDVLHTAAGGRTCLDGCDVSRASAHVPRKREREPKVWYGLIASGNSVIANAKSRAEKIKILDADVMCFEMEAVGVMAAFPCLVIRGIADYADSHKHKSWQSYAAAVAAACAKDIIARIPPSNNAEGGHRSQTSQAYPKRAREGTQARNYVGQGFISTGSGPVSSNMTFTNHYR
ncbi:phosphorylase superfamily protein [Sarocladium implicatum]|nr:phosphorylase superfamily protein [Sarocladium implicatum]